MSDILNELKDEDFVFKKKFGQNFITDINLLDAIIRDANINENSNILEIGAGAGTLTERLGKFAHKVLSYEIDKSLIEYLTNKFKDTNILIKNLDFMQEKAVNVNDYFANEKIDVVANIPYYITTPIIFKLIEEDFNVNSICVMVQKEVAERVVSAPNTKNYGITSVVLNAIGKTEIMRVVKKEMFTPKPKIDSAILRIELFDKNKLDFDFNKLQKVVKTAFQMRRKTIYNNLKSIFSLEKLLELKINPQSRPENLTIEEYILLSKNI